MSAILFSFRMPLLIDIEASSPEPRTVTPLQTSDGEDDGAAAAEPLLLDVATVETKKRSA